MKAKNAEIVGIGTELLQGGLEDTNGRFLAEALHGISIEVVYRTTVGDDRQRIREVLRQALDRAAVVVATGGLGPTEGERTLGGLGDVTGRPLILHGETLKRIEERFARRRVVMPESVRRQAMVPEGVLVLPNRHGTAPGLVWQEDRRLLVVLPGPPREMRPLFNEQVLPILLRRTGRGRRIRTRTIKVCGLLESQVEERIIDLLRADPGTVGLLARLEEVVGRLLRLQGKTVAVAESCTGGLIVHRITNVPGSSEYFERGIVAYSNRAKEELLQVPSSLIEQHGAVSPEAACAMAAGVRRLARADLGLGVTGIAGPGGGTKAKPVGLTYIALADPQGEEWCEHRFRFAREENKLWGSQMALEMLRRSLLKATVKM